MQMKLKTYYTTKQATDKWENSMELEHIMAHLSSQCVVNLAQQRWMFTVINWTVVSQFKYVQVTVNG